MISAEINKSLNITISLPNNRPIVIKEETRNFCKFNIMPDKYVTEELFIKEYKIHTDRVEGLFDRQYSSDMQKSPDHLVIFTFMAHTQKLLYLYLCYLLGHDYDPFCPEKIKIWATKIDINLPKLITDNTNLIHTVKMISLINTKPKQYIANFTSFLGSRLQIFSSCNIYDIT